MEKQLNTKVHVKYSHVAPECNDQKTWRFSVRGRDEDVAALRLPGSHEVTLIIIEGYCGLELRADNEAASNDFKCFAGVVAREPLPSVSVSFKAQP